MSSTSLTTETTTSTPTQQVQVLVVETAAGNFICALADWLASGRSLTEFLLDNGVLPAGSANLAEVLTVKSQLMSQYALDNLPEW